MISQTEHESLPNVGGRGASAGAGRGRHALSEQYAAIVRRVLDLQQDSGAGPVAVGVTSSARGAGVTTTAINVALTASRCENRRVLLIDPHSQDAGPADRLGAAPTAGLADVVAGEGMLGECVVPTRFERLSYLGAGSRPAQLAVDYETSALVNLLDELKTEFDFIVVDLPVATELTECLSLGRILDGVLLVLSMPRLDARDAERTLARLRASGSRVLGAVCNQTP